jgi:hypothetical protein
MSTSTEKPSTLEKSPAELAEDAVAAAEAAEADAKSLMHELAAAERKALRLRRAASHAVERVG